MRGGGKTAGRRDGTDDFQEGDEGRCVSDKRWKTIRQGSTGARIIFCFRGTTYAPNGGYNNYNLSLMRNSTLLRRRAFPLVEMMIVVAIIALLAAIATSNILRARKR